MLFEMRKATTDETEAIVELVQSVYRGESSQKGWTTEAQWLGGQRVDAPMVREMIEKPDTALLVFRQDGKVRACVYLEKGVARAHLGMLSVHTSLQGQQIGQKILKYAEGFIAREWKLKNIEIEVLWPRQELIAWYERRGFVKTGNTKPFPTDPRFGIPKIKDLYFYEMTKPV